MGEREKERESERESHRESHFRVESPGSSGITKRKKADPEDTWARERERASERVPERVAF